MKIKKGVVGIEYAVLIITIVLGFIFMRTYILRSFSGGWRSLGESIGFGRQYEALSCLAPGQECLHTYDCCSKRCKGSTGHKTCCLGQGKVCDDYPGGCCPGYSCRSSGTVSKCQ